MTIVARGYTAIAQALESRGFLLVADLPAGTSITRKRGMFIVRLP